MGGYIEENGMIIKNIIEWKLHHHLNSLKYLIVNMEEKLYAIIAMIA